MCFLEPQPVTIDETIVASLVEMGFHTNGCKKAVYYTQSSSLENAMNWVMEHMGDPGKILQYN